MKEEILIEYKCEECGRHWYIKEGERQEYDIQFGCPFGCDTSGKRVRRVKATLQEVD